MQTRDIIHHLLTVARAAHGLATPEEGAAALKVLSDAKDPKLVGYHVVDLAVGLAAEGLARSPLAPGANLHNDEVLAMANGTGVDVLPEWPAVVPSAAA